MKGLSLGLRKGAWTKEEDDLLRKCIGTYGEGRWHLVPIRAGLNRCRKSCRLRWLNYLKSNIRRGEFADDEVDLMIRLHKLLGNRWSLIAGRLPGRTANDVKNYWNTRKREKTVSCKENHKNTPNITKTNIIKPRPRSVSKNFIWKTLCRNNNNNFSIELPPPSENNNNETQWWESLLNDNIEGNPISSSGSEEETRITDPNLAMEKETSFEEELSNWWTDFSNFDVDLGSL